MSEAILRRRLRDHDWQPVALGLSGDRVWRLRARGRHELYVKIGERAAAEADRLRWLAARSVPAAEVVDSDADWMITRAVAGRPASDLWPGKQRTAVVDAVAGAIRQLHAVDVATCPFDRRLSAVMHSPNVDGRQAEWDELARARPAVEQVVVCHGDVSLPNLLVDPATLAFTGFVDVGRLGVADRYVDLALAVRSLLDPRNAQYGPRHADRFLAAYGESAPDMHRLDFYRRLDDFT